MTLRPPTSVHNYSRLCLDINWWLFFATCDVQYQCLLYIRSKNKKNSWKIAKICQKIPNFRISNVLSTIRSVWNCLIVLLWYKFLRLILWLRYVSRKCFNRSILIKLLIICLQSQDYRWGYPNKRYPFNTFRWIWEM